MTRINQQRPLVKHGNTQKCQKEHEVRRQSARRTLILMDVVGEGIREESQNCQHMVRKKEDLAGHIFYQGHPS